MRGRKTDREKAKHDESRKGKVEGERHIVKGLKAVR